MRVKNILALGLSLALVAGNGIGVSYGDTPEREEAALTAREEALAEAKEETDAKAPENMIVMVGARFAGLEYAARDHMKVIREKKINIESIGLKKTDGKIENPKADLLKFLPNRIVEKRVEGEWELYSLDYFTPGEYRYIYTVAVGKQSPYYVVPTGEAKADENDSLKDTTITIHNNFAYGQSNDSNQQEKLEETVLPEGGDPSYSYYAMIGKTFRVEEEKAISKLYLQSDFDIHKVSFGDLMKRATVNVEKIVLTDNTEVQFNAEEAPFIVNAYKDDLRDPKQFKLHLDSYKNEEGERGNILHATENTAFPVGRYRIKYYIRPNYEIGKYRFLIQGTDDTYGSGTEFYVNQELYTAGKAVPKEDLSTRILLTSPLFDVKKVKEKTSEEDSKDSGKDTADHSDSSSGNSSSDQNSENKGKDSGKSSDNVALDSDKNTANITDKPDNSSANAKSDRASAGIRNSSGGLKSRSNPVGQVLGVDRGLSGGHWVLDENGWWYQKTDGTYPKGVWAYEPYNGKSYWYYFLDSGYMATGWLEVNGSKYYLFPHSDGWKGRMLTGWQWIDGNCYYLDSHGENEGALYRNITTPDGFTVDQEGRWTLEGVIQRRS